MATQRFIYVGPAALASAFAQMLYEGSVRVAWDPPDERRGLAAVPQEVIVNLMTIGSTAAVTAAGKSALSRFRERFGSVAKIEAEEPTADEDRN